MKKFIILVCVVAVVFALFGGCTTSVNEGAGTGESPGDTKTDGSEKDNRPEASQKPVALSMLIPLYVPQPPAESDPVKGELEKALNAELEIIYVPNSTYHDKINVNIASRQLPDVYVQLRPKQESFVNAARAEMFWEVGSLLGNYEYLKDLKDEIALVNAAIDGKNYGIPRLRPVSRHGITYRKDWADRLGIEKPTNMEEVYEMLKAFTYEDPDRNGAHDTFGLLPSYEELNQEQWFGGVAHYGVNEKNEIYVAYAQDEAIEKLKWFKRLYDEKIIPGDFAALPKAEKKNYFRGSKTGALIDVTESSYFQEIFDEARKVDPDLKDEDIVDSMILFGEDSNVAGQTGLWGQFVIPKTSVKNQERLDEVLGILNKINSPEVQNLLYYGVEGVHHKVVDGKIEFDNQYGDIRKTYNQYGISIGAPVAVSNRLTPEKMPVWKERSRNYHKKAIADGRVINNVTMPYVSATYSQKGSELDKIIQDAKVKYIMGVIDEEGYRKEMQRWRDNGGDKMLEEYTKAYQATR